MCAFIVSCRDIAGVGPITYTGGDGGGCFGELVFSNASSNLDEIRVAGGFIFGQITSSGIISCPTSGCATPTSLFTAPAQDRYKAFAVSDKLLYYAVETGSEPTDGGATPGAVHSLAFDGTSDQQIGGSAPNAYFVGVSGTNVFWVDDPNQGTNLGPASVNCIGCSGSSSVPWITALNVTYAFTTSTNNVYVLADLDGTGANETLFACGVTSPCLATPKKLLSNVDPSATNTSLAADDTYAYLARTDHADIVRVDMSGVLTEIVNATTAYAITVDKTGNLYYADDTGTVYGTKADGSGTPKSLACGTATSLALALATDDTSLYYIFNDPLISVYKVPKLP